MDAKRASARVQLCNGNVHFPRYGALAFTGLLLVSGCSTHRGAITKPYGGPGFAEVQDSRFGTIAIREESGPASFSFQKAKGRLGSAKEAILDSAELGLSGPGAGVIVTGCVLSDGIDTAQTECDAVFYAAVAGVAGGATAIGAALAGPVVGAEGLIRSLKSVNPAELAEREATLNNALSEMAEQHSFRDALLQTGAQNSRGGLLAADLNNPSGKTATADAILEARVDDLRLERAGSGEGSYVLRIKTHARLVRLADGAVCLEQRAEYRSGRALFLDWTLQSALQGVAETGYRALARYYIDKLVDGSRDHTNTQSVVKRL
jgi:hypothetical protein